MYDFVDAGAGSGLDVDVQASINLVLENDPISGEINAVEVILDSARQNYSGEFDGAVDLVASTYRGTGVGLLSNPSTADAIIEFAIGCATNSFAAGTVESPRV